MKTTWFMLTMIGKDKPGMVAAISGALAEHGVTLGETSMLRLGGNFTVMMMVSGAADEQTLRESLTPILESQGMCLHVDPIEGGLHKHVIPNVHVTVSGADRLGIVSQVTAVLAEMDINILDLESDVAGTEDKPIYIMQISAVSTLDIEGIETALSSVRESDVSVSVSAIETYIG